MAAMDQNEFAAKLPAAELELYQRLEPEEQERWRVAAQRMATERRRRGVPLSNERKLGFLAALSAGMTITAAADLVGVSLHTLYNQRRSDSEFAADWEAALEAGTGEIESRLARWVMGQDAGGEYGGPSMAQVRSAEILLRARSRRYNAPPSAQSASATVQAPNGGGVIKVSVGTPGPD